MIIVNENQRLINGGPQNEATQFQPQLFFPGVSGMKGYNTVKICKNKETLPGVIATTQPKTMA